eukprot:3298149-Rhodomonas_salina.3
MSTVAQRKNDSAAQTRHTPYAREDMKATSGRCISSCCHASGKSFPTHCMQRNHCGDTCWLELCSDD